MVNRKYVLGIVILVLILGFITNAAGNIQNNPTGNQGKVYNNSGEQKKFSISITPSVNNTVKWYVDENVNLSQNNKSLSNITITETAGNHNITVISTNISNPSDSDSTNWTWVVTDAAPGETAPIITTTLTPNPLDTSAYINFTVNQSNALTKVLYGTSLSTMNLDEWDNATHSNKVIQITGLLPGTKYFYNVTAYNKTNTSLHTNSLTFNFTTIDPTDPNITTPTLDEPTTSSVNISFEVNQSNAKTNITYGLDESSLSESTPLGTSTKIKLSNLTEGKKYFYKVYAYNNTNQTFKSNSTIRNFTTKSPGPKITSQKIDGQNIASINITVGESINLTVHIGNQGGNLTWREKNVTDLLVPEKSVVPDVNEHYLFSRNKKGTYIITANLSNDNGSDPRVFTINNRLATFGTGNRIWDGDRNPLDFNTTYTWTPQSFSGFYYDSKDGIGSENIKIELGGRSDRTIDKNHITYTTEPQEVYFNHNGWGKYQVIGFMADKYFAGYKNHTIPEAVDTFDEESAIAQGQLHKILYDDDTKRTISVGGTLALKDGYVLKATDIDMNGRTMLLVLLKDGTEVDSNMLKGGETYVYKKRVGGVDALPLILVRFDGVFAGTELQAAFLKGIFQISEDVTEVKSGNKFGVMEVTNVGKEKIVMKNTDTDVGLSQGSIVDLMGDLKIIVADNTDLRFALSVDRKGSFEVRSTVFDEIKNNITEWTPYNFGMNIGKTIIGFYYNLDDGLGNEKLSMTEPHGSSIPESKLVYTTEPEQVLFTHDEWGRYQVIGFMADKYFAGYKGHVNTGMVDSFDDTSAMAQGQLHKVLIDDDTKRTISVGGTLALKDGYVLKATDIDLRGRTMFLVLLKDGAEVDSNMLQGGETYVYKKRVGNVEDLPLILVRFDNVFAGTELQAAFIKGIFQISETATQVKNGDKIGEMEVTSVNNLQIEMQNSGDIGLDRNTENVLMGNIKLKVADSNTLRFYFKVDVTEEMIADQLVINTTSRVMAGDNINIQVTAGGKASENASLTLDTDIGTTDSNGSLNYSIPKTLKNGTYTIKASKTGFLEATKNIEIEKYVDYRLSIEAPANANQYETIKIKVLYNGTAMSGASVVFDNISIGSTDSNGEVNYRLETSGTHSITASKQSYIMVSRDIDIRAPYSEFKALDINITPNPVFTGEDFVVKSNISNVGTKSDTLPVELIINGSAVDNRSVTLTAGEKVEINFTRNEAMAANITVSILGQSNLLIVQQKPTNYLLIAAIATGIGAVIIYVLTSKGLLSLELLKQKFGLLSEKFNLLFKK